MKDSVAGFIDLPFHSMIETAVMRVDKLLYPIFFKPYEFPAHIGDSLANCPSEARRKCNTPLRVIDH